MKFSKYRCLVFVAASTIALAPLAEAKPAAKSKVASKFLIIPGVRVGPVSLGMTRQQVRKAIGKPDYVYYGNKIYGGYWRESYKDYHLAFSGERANAGVVVIEIESAKFKTASGLSIKSSLQDIRDKYPKMTVVREYPFELWTLSYNDRPKGIGFCFECPRSNDLEKDKNIWPKNAQSPAKIGVYKRGANWKGFYSSE